MERTGTHTKHAFHAIGALALFLVLLWVAEYLKQHQLVANLRFILLCMAGASMMGGVAFYAFFIDPRHSRRISNEEKLRTSIGREDHYEDKKLRDLPIYNIREMNLRDIVVEEDKVIDNRMIFLLYFAASMVAFWVGA